MFRSRDRKPKRSQLTLFFATDVHGSTVCFKKFVNAAKFYGADILILGGDVSGKMVVPIAEQPEGGHLSSFAGKVVRLESEEEIDRFSRRLADMGFYPKRMTEDEFAKLREDPERQDALFEQLIKERIEEWVEWARPRLTDSGVKCYAAPGNDDGFFVDSVITDSGVIELLEMRVVDIDDGLEILSTGWSNRTPWNTERECSEDELQRKIEEMLGRVKDPHRTIFNIHVPPHETALDQCPELDKELRPVHKGGNPVMTSAGSTAVRALIERHEPALGLHGHIHEGRGIANVGKTVCVNPGSNYSEGVLNGSLIRLHDGHVEDVQLTQG
ncbi:MAG: metallophosphoesterase family protein [Solirubrobacteraceae bacterium]